MACRACTRSGCLVELDRKRGSVLFVFSFWAAELSLFPFGGAEISLFPSPQPQTSYPTLVGLIGIFITKLRRCGFWLYPKNNDQPKKGSWWDVMKTNNLVVRKYERPRIALSGRPCCLLAIDQLIDKRLMIDSGQMQFING